MAEELNFGGIWEAFRIREKSVSHMASRNHFTLSFPLKQRRDQYPPSTRAFSIPGRIIWMSASEKATFAQGQANGNQHAQP
jgi:hypothetical protein